MRALRFLVLVGVGLWLVGEVAVASLAERRIEQEVADRTNEVASVRADIDSFPLVAGTIVTGRVRNLDVTLDGIARQGLEYAEVRFELEGIEVDRPAILQRRLRVSDIDRGRVVAEIDLGVFGGIAGRILSQLSDQVSVSGGSLRVGPASFPLASDLMPCEPDLDTSGERIMLSCEIDEVPPVLLDALQR